MIGNDRDEAYRDRVKEDYRFAEWAGRTKEGDRHISDFRIRPGDLQRYTLQEQDELPALRRQRRIIRYLFSPLYEDDRGRLIATVFECHSVLDAHETLIDVVISYMAPSLPRCETRGLKVGDICFGGHGPLSLRAIFARFNILVEIKSTSPEGPEVGELGRDIDELILNWRPQAF